MLPWAVWLIGALAMLGLLVFSRAERRTLQITFQTHPNAVHSVTAAETPNPCHHAVVCGGVHSAPGPNFKKTVLPYNIWGYVQFTLNGKTHFTRAKRMIAKGTIVWEDAFGHIILERCGNEVTQTADVDPTPAVEPSDIFPSIPPEIDVVPPTVDIPPTSPQPPSGPVPPQTPPNNPPTYPTPPCCGNTIPPITVPEPSGLVLTLMGIFAILIAGRLYRGKKDGRTERVSKDSGHNKED